MASEELGTHREILVLRRAEPEVLEKPSRDWVTVDPVGWPRPEGRCAVLEVLGQAVGPGIQRHTLAMTVLLSSSPSIRWK